jgi:signal transduction histidine kinase
MRRLLGTALSASGLLFLLAWAATPLAETFRIGAIDVLWFTTSFLAGIACLWAGRRPENAHLRKSFGFFAAAALFWAAGQAVWTYQELVQQIDSPVFAIADVGYWSSVLLQAMGILFWPRERAVWDVGRVLDFVLIGGFAALFGFELILQPMLELEVSGLATVYAIVYPPGEILLFGAILAVLTVSGWRDRSRIELIAFTLILLCIGDAGYTYLGDDYETGGFLDPLWTLGFVGVGWAALAPAEWRERRGWISDRVRTVAPSAALAAVALFGIVLGLSGRAPVGTAERVAVFALVLLLAARQAHVQLKLLEQMAEQRQLQEQLQHAQKLEAVGRLAGGVAHDFNNLLTAINGYSELALHQLSDGHPVRSDIAEVQRATQRASELTRQLLAFSRRQVLAPRVVDLNAVVRDAERMLRRLLGGDVELTTELARKPALVRADPGQLEQVITNLVLNARDAMPGGGTVEIHTVIVLDTVHLFVRDEGVGMDDTTRSRLFEPFFTTKDLGKGTGLGLAMVHGIVTQSNGTISVDSTPGRGTRFEIVFPLSGPDAAEPVSPDSLEMEGSETILVVEDEPAVLDLARRMLELEGYAVVTASSGAEALRLCEELTSIDVLLTDIVMPGLNGRELASTLCERIPGLRVVLMSGYTQDSEPLDGLLAAGAAFVEKPFTARALVSEVRGVLDAAAA